MRTIAVIGKNFGDEGKGLAVDYFCLHAQRPMVVRHNGGAQSGHTVERKHARGERFVFHELSSGSLRAADTLWIDSFYPDIYKLGQEIEDFRSAFGFVPQIYAMENTCMTVLDDVLINMALETSRGELRHGSCGMGINECDLRTKAGYRFTLQEVSQMNARDICSALLHMRNTYVPQRLKEIRGSLTGAASSYLELLSDENVLKNAAETIASNLRYVKVLSEESLKERLESVGTLIFETGQGLLLDSRNKEYAPHVTASYTGLDHPCAFLGRIGSALDEVVYVSRTYVTRHGCGMLRCECPKGLPFPLQRDRTNEPNEWQGQIRYACHENETEFVAQVRKDLRRHGLDGIKVSLFLTHLNETKNCVVMKDGQIPVETFIKLPKIKETFDTFYLSSSRYSEDVRVAVENYE